MNHVTIITGASDGLGKVLALHHAAPGRSIVLTARSEDKLHAVAEACRERGADTLVIPTNVSQQAACANLIERAVHHFGRLDMLLNNAALSIEGRFADYVDLTPFESVMQVNYFGSLYCTHAALPYLKQTQGRIVAVCSLGGKFGLPLETGYVASKHAMSGFFNALRIELAGSEVSVTVAYPGFINTSARANSIGPDGKPLGAGKRMPDGAMSPEACATIILRAAQRRQRQVVMTPQGKLGMWVQLVAPGLLDRIIQHQIGRFA